MTVSVVAVGNSAQDWHKTPCDLSIMCNDGFKFGVHPDWLVLVNTPRKFLKRLEVIKQTQAKIVFVSSLKVWTPYFPKAERLRRLVEYHTRTRLRIGAHYTLRTSPIICISLALEAGATDIILWGIDFRSHKSVVAGTKSGEREIDLYKDFFKKVEALGVRLWRGANGSVFDNVIPLWHTVQ